MDAMSTVPLMGMMTHCAHWFAVIVMVSLEVFSNETSPSFWTLTPLPLMATAANHATPLPDEKMKAELCPPSDLKVICAFLVLMTKYLAPARGCLPKESYAAPATSMHAPMAFPAASIARLAIARVLMR